MVRVREKHQRQYVQTTQGPREAAASLSLRGGIGGELLKAGWILKRRDAGELGLGGAESPWWTEVWVKATRQGGQQVKGNGKRLLCKSQVAWRTNGTFKKYADWWLTLTTFYWNFYRAVQMSQHLLYMRQNPLVNSSESLPTACAKGALGYMHIFSRFPLMDGD